MDGPGNFFCRAPRRARARPHNSTTTRHARANDVHPRRVRRQVRRARASSLARSSSRALFPTVDARERIYPGPRGIAIGAWDRSSATLARRSRPFDDGAD